MNDPRRLALLKAALAENRELLRARRAQEK
jgi:hypothetical protein